MAPYWGWVLLIVAFATSFALGGASAQLLVKWAEVRALWVFAVPFTLWWLVAALSLAVYGFDVRVTVPTFERSAPPAGGPLTPRDTIDTEEP
jgi:hypothetical protein